MTGKFAAYPPFCVANPVSGTSSTDARLTRLNVRVGLDTTDWASARRAQVSRVNFMVLRPDVGQMVLIELI